MNCILTTHKPVYTMATIDEVDAKFIEQMRSESKEKLIDIKIDTTKYDIHMEAHVASYANVIYWIIISEMPYMKGSDMEHPFRSVQHDFHDDGEEIVSCGGIVPDNPFVRSIIQEICKSDTEVATHIGKFVPADYRGVLIDTLNKLWD